MNFTFLEGTAPAADGANLIAQFAPMILIFAVFYFLIIAPQRKRDKQTKAMRSALKVGDEVITIGGVIGKVVRIKDDTVFIESTPDKTKLQFERSAVRDVTKVLEIEE